MNWYRYIACFFSGFFLLNVLPHLLHGINGEAFPTPFADPPFKGLSSPTVNTVWALTNLLISYGLAKFGKVSWQKPWTFALLLMGFATLSLFMSILAASILHPNQ